MAVSQGDPVRELKAAGRDLSEVPISRLPAVFDKVAFLCVNSYRSYRANLGVGPINDAVLVAKCLKRFGFEIWFLHNPHARNFLEYVGAFLERTGKQLVLFYAGQGTKATAEGDQAFVFDDGAVMEEEFVSHLKEKKTQQSKLVLITDDCHSGSIWDLQPGNPKAKKLVPGIISCSVVSDVVPAKQTVVEGIEQGAFAYNLTKTLFAEPLLTPAELGGKLKAVLRKYSQTVSVGTSTPALMGKPLFS
jgi:hypothetical protein